MDIAYKVLMRTYHFKISPARLVSAISDHQVEYKINEFISRPDNCGPLTVFDSFDNAKCFTQMIGRFYIYSCEYTLSKDNKLWYYESIFEKNLFKVKNFPKGTIFTNSVKLIKHLP